METDKLNNCKHFKKLKSLTFKGSTFKDYDLNTDIEHLTLSKPKELFITKKATYKTLFVRNKNELDSVVIFNYPELCREILKPETFSRLNMLAMDEYNIAASLLEKGSSQLEGFCFKGEIGLKGLDFSNCPNLREVGLIGVSNENATIDLSKCTKLEQIESEGDCKIKRIIVPNGFDKTQIKGLDNVEILTAGEAKAKDLLASIRTPGTARSDLPQNADKAQRFLALRGMTTETPVRSSSPSRNPQEAERRIQHLLLRKQQMAAHFA